MISREELQKFIDEHADEISEILPGGLKNSKGKWVLVCPVMERFNLDFSKILTKTQKKSGKRKSK